MTAIEAWGERLTPAFGDTLRRFPFPIVLAAIATGLFLVVINQPVFSFERPLFGLPTETWMRAAVGVGTAAIFATAGVFFAETQPRNWLASAILIFLVPALVGVLFQIRDTTWFVPYALPVIGALWLSVASFTAMPREEAEPRFWWLNHRAIATGAIAGLALGIICVGVVAIERSVALLFNVDATTPIYRYVLPVICLFFGPLYWLSTLPRVSDYDPRVLVAPDFLARAVGLVGKFVLIPLLLAYAAILLLYAGQIVVTRQLPQGTLSWMVLSFVIAGAATWLVLYPPFVRESAIVRAFQRLWFWLTLLPLVLFFLAVWVRIDAYGFTPERLVLVWGGVWATLLSLIFLIGRGDIRMIPGLAAVALILMTFGPWNLDNLPRWQQGLRLDLLMSKPGPNGESPAGPAAWTSQETASARSAIEYLAYSGPESRAELARILRVYGHEFAADTADTYAVFTALGIALQEELVRPGPAVAPAIMLLRDQTVPVELTTTPYYIAHVYVQTYPALLPSQGFTTQLVDSALVVARDSVELARTDLQPLLLANDGQRFPSRGVDFAVEGRLFRLVPEQVTLTNNAITYVDAMLFSATAD